MEERIYRVYMHENKYNSKKYIGITKQDVNIRWGKDGKGYGWTYKNQPSYSTHFSNAIKKYGWDSFTHVILYESLTKEEACTKEIELINQYKTTNPMYGYNQTTGGQCGTSGLQWFTDGTNNYYGTQCPENMKKGRTLNLTENSREKLRTSSNKSWYTNGIDEVYLNPDQDVPDGYVKGRKPGIGQRKSKCSAHNKGKHRYTDGKTYIYAYTCPEGFRKSASDFGKHRKHLTNGTLHRFIFEDELEEFLKANDGWYLFNKRRI